MNNANKPAYPIWTEDMPVEGNPGLTKREAFAMADWTSRELERAANEVCSRENGMETNFEHFATVNNIDVMIKARLLLADKLLKALEE